MELSSNWKELQAKTPIAVLKTQPHNHTPLGGKKSLKRKSVSVPVSPPSKKMKPTKDHMKVDISAERVNEGLSGRCVFQPVSLVARFSIDFQYRDWQIRCYRL